DLTFDGTPSVLVGTAANEVLQGGDGNDTLTGGAGADIFKVGQGNDHITDYKLTDGDKVDITSVLNSAEEDHSRLGFHTDGGKAVLEIYDDNAHTNLLGSVTFDNITDAVDLNSLLGKIDLDHSS
ncbi:MAG TPA: type I secretion C-terminal target domain-containing protein, partial [Smithella sp.]|nr:type I secretion C-terminal target domain-containing protein [Smithella sp.]